MISLQRIRMLRGMGEVATSMIREVGIVGGMAGRVDEWANTKAVCRGKTVMIYKT